MAQHHLQVHHTNNDTTATAMKQGPKQQDCSINNNTNIERWEEKKSIAEKSNTQTKIEMMSNIICMPHE